MNKNAFYFIIIIAIIAAIFFMSQRTDDAQIASPEASPVNGMVETPAPQVTDGAQPTQAPADAVVAPAAADMGAPADAGVPVTPSADSESAVPPAAEGSVVPPSTPATEGQ